MRFIGLTRPDGTIIQVNVDHISVITEHDTGAYIKVFGGIQIVTNAPTDVAKLVPEVIPLTRPDGRPVWVHRKKVTSIVVEGDATRLLLGDVTQVVREAPSDIGRLIAT